MDILLWSPPPLVVCVAHGLLGVTMRFCVSQICKLRTPTLPLHLFKSDKTLASAGAARLRCCGRWLCLVQSRCGTGEAGDGKRSQILQDLSADRCPVVRVDVEVRKAPVCAAQYCLPSRCNMRVTDASDGCQTQVWHSCGRGSGGAFVVLP